MTQASNIFIKDTIIKLLTAIGSEKEIKKYLNIFKDHPYIFNLGHGIQPETKVEAVERLVNVVRSF